MSAKNSEAVFYKQKNLSGESYSYQEREVAYTLPSGLNDNFLSVDVGELVKVYAWKHYNDTQSGQIHRVWESTQNDISSIQGLSKFVVSPKDSELLAIKVINNSGNNKPYYAFIRTYTIANPVRIHSGHDYEIVGLIKKDGQKYVADIVIFDEATNVPVIQGAAYFSYDSTTNSLHATTYQEIFPKDLELVKSTDYRFDLVIKSIPHETEGKVMSQEKA
ncbi:hypothetical protein D4100_10585 [Serratia inhibens]|uniref:Uncharacterized protein n=1 Tax=Serratia inhibens TaxID=2338073 RepID=A0AA92X4N2_9GAMM|nr:beta/gamma crystallin domain-containing protein [Serratia inhibens]RJF56044.1 hypothetical protein D4100_10585 [Serratia inhibens]